METVRQKIVEILKVRPVDAGYLSRAISVSQRMIESHLEHVAKSAGKLFEITPAACRDCEYQFRGRTRTTKPTKCPKCNGEDISPPLFQIKV